MRRLQVSPVQRDDDVPSPGVRQVKLLEGRGWGDGEHPSTWMCLEFLETAITGKWGGMFLFFGPECAASTGSLGTEHGSSGKIMHA